MLRLCPQLFAEEYRVSKSWLHIGIVFSLYAVNQFCRMNTVTEEVKPEDHKLESEKKIFYCEVSVFLDGFSECMLKCRPEVLMSMLSDIQT